MKVRDRIHILTDLFLGALWADQKFTMDERLAVRDLLADLLLVSSDALPPEVEERLRNFDPSRFDLRRAAEAFMSDPPMAKRRLLELVARMAHADGVLDMAEDDYLRELAVHLRMEPEEYADLVIDYEIEEVRESFERLRAMPPPMAPPPLPEK